MEKVVYTNPISIKVSSLRFNSLTHGRIPIDMVLRHQTSFYVWESYMHMIMYTRVQITEVFYFPCNFEKKYIHGWSCEFGTMYSKTCGTQTLHCTLAMIHDWNLSTYNDLNVLNPVFITESRKGMFPHKQSKVLLYINWPCLGIICMQ